MKRFIEMVNNKTESEKVRMLSEQLLYLSVQLKDAAISNSENKERDVKRIKENMELCMGTILLTLDNVCPAKNNTHYCDK